MIELSKRMQAVADMVPAGSIAADIGCDHGFVSIYLVQQKICPFVYAADVRPGPLARAKEHIEACGLEKYIKPVLSDGLKEVAVKDSEAVSGAEGILAAGMGGHLMIRILSDVPQKTKKLSWVILEPQSDVELVRRWLWENNFVIAKESMVYEDGKYYPVMFAMNRERTDAAVLESAENEYGQTAEELCSAGFSESESKAACDWLGGLLIRQKSAVLKQFLKHTIENDRKVLAGMPQVSEKEEKTEKEQRIEARCREIRVRMSLSERVLAFMEESCKR